MMAHQEDLAIIMTIEQGKALAESRGEVAYGAALHGVVRRASQAHRR
jgi:acyl-CoA reductase-like NAD-dependent aldehyde dehydrogenase